MKNLHTCMYTLCCADIMLVYLFIVYLSVYLLAFYTDVVHCRASPLKNCDEKFACEKCSAAYTQKHSITMDRYHYCLFVCLFVYLIALRLMCSALQTGKKCQELPTLC